MCLLCAQVAELSYWKQQAVSRYDGLERDNQGLRKRVAELLRLGEKRSKSGGAQCCCWLGAQVEAGQADALRPTTWLRAAATVEGCWQKQHIFAYLLSSMICVGGGSCFCFTHAHAAVVGCWSAGNFEPIDEAFKIALTKPIGE
jgi:hypothetical protein